MLAFSLSLSFFFLPLSPLPLLCPTVDHQYPPDVPSTCTCHHWSSCVASSPVHCPRPPQVTTTSVHQLFPPPVLTINIRPSTLANRSLPLPSFSSTSAPLYPPSFSRPPDSSPPQALPFVCLPHYWFSRIYKMIVL